MNWNKEKIIRTAERVLKRSYHYLERRTDSNNQDDNYQLDYIVAKGSNPKPDTAIAYAHYMDEIISFTPLDSDSHFQNIWDLAFNFDNDLFRYLEKGYDLIGMSLESHCAAWSEIADYHDNDGITHTKGMQRYLDYCKRNRVTAELLHREIQYNGMDVMTLYDKKAVKAEDVKTPKDSER